MKIINLSYSILYDVYFIGNEYHAPEIVGWKLSSGNWAENVVYTDMIAKDLLEES